MTTVRTKLDIEAEEVQKTYPWYEPHYTPREKAIKEILERNGFLTLDEIASIAKQFNRSTLAIKATILKLVNGSTFHPNPRTKQRIYDRDKGICYLCNQPTTEHNWIIEHKIPARAGGKPTDDNLAVACSSCNQKKRHTDAIKYPERYWK